MGTNIKPLIVVDVLGGLAALACAAAGIGFGWIGSDQTARRIDVLTNQGIQLNRRMAALKTALHRQQDLFQQRTQAFGARDLLPEASPVERELRTVTDLARSNGLEVTGLVPIGSWNYPGLREVRYRMTTSGSYTSYVRFLRAFEQAASWSDLTFIELSSADPQSSEQKLGELTISLYAAAPRESLTAENP